MIHASRIALTRVDLRVEWRFDLRVNEEMANPSGVDLRVNEGLIHASTREICPLQVIHASTRVELRMKWFDPHVNEV